MTDTAATIGPYADPYDFGFKAMARAMRPRKVITVSQWADAERRLSSKGSAHPGQWRTSANPPLREPMDCMSARSTVHDIVLMFPIQKGKALSLDTPLPTPTGWVTMGSVQPGQMVLGAQGQPVCVVAASPVFHDHDCYQITFSDGATVVADAGHRWDVVDLQARNEHRKELKRRGRLGSTNARKRQPISGRTEDHQVILHTHELADSFRTCGKQSRYAVPLALPLNLPTAALPIDPYVLGVWLGDGYSASGQLALNESDAPHIVDRIKASGFVVRMHKTAWDIARDSHCLTVLLNPRSSGLDTFHAQLARAGLLGNKHIPPQYLRASHSQRLALLQGLMDTDGHASKNGVAEITSSYQLLADGIVELLHSLGFEPVVRWRKTKARDSARITTFAFADSQAFSLPRKASALPVGPSARGQDMARLRYIVSVDPVPSVPTRCIAVDSVDHLYLCGRQFIPTHNTEVAINAVGYCMDHDPGPIMVCLPGEVSMNKWVAQKLNPAIEETPAMRRALVSVASRDASNTRTFKDFAGGQLYIEHAGSPARLKSTTVRTLIVDEVDEFAANFVGGDDPLSMLNGRTSAYPGTYKRLYISTPQTKGASRTEELWLKSDQRRYHVPCPHCGQMQHLQWSGLHWATDGSSAWYVCAECGAVIDEHHKTAMIAAGSWVPHNPGAKVRGYTINCLYYQFGLGPRWVDLAEMWRDAQNDPAKLKTFVNDRLAEPWEDAAMRNVKHNAIADRAEPYPLRTAPAGVLAITAGVDTQDNRLAVQIVGWGVGMAFWVLDYVELPGDPADDAVWSSLTELLNTNILHACGVMMRVEAVAIDMGGHRTEAVKHYVRQRRIARPMAIYGAVPNNAPVLSKGKMADVDWRGRLDKRGVLIHQVGTVNVKHWLYGRLSTDADRQPDQRLTHFSDQLDSSYFSGLVSETFNPAKNRFEKKRGARNEPLDTWGYAFAAAHHPELRLPRNTKADWDTRAQRLQTQAAASKPAAYPTAPAAPLPTPKPAVRPRSDNLGDWNFDSRN